VLDNALENKPPQGLTRSAFKLARRLVPPKVKVALRWSIRAAKLRGSSLVGRHRCLLCGNRVRRFNPLPPDAISYGFKYSPDEAETCNAANYSCPRCEAADRERLYALYLQDYLRTIEPNKSEPIKFIDFAPTETLSRFIQKLISESPLEFCYRSADLFNETADDRVDITEMPIYADDSVDFFVCSHVLEHVTDDQMAMRELYRILRPGRQGILVVPIVVTLKEIDEDPSVTDPAERWRRFGQDDHVRLYSKDGFLQRVRQAGFSIRELGQEYFGRNRFWKYGIGERSILYIVKKDN
jgi:SAM-dependent methyltransferase